MKFVIAIIVLMFITGCATQSRSDKIIDSMLEDMGYECDNDSTKTIVIY